MVHLHSDCYFVVIFSLHYFIYKILGYIYKTFLDTKRGTFIIPEISLLVSDSDIVIHSHIGKTLIYSHDHAPAKNTAMK